MGSSASRMAETSSETDCSSSRPMPPSLSTKRRTSCPPRPRLTSTSTSSKPRPSVDPLGHGPDRLGRLPCFQPRPPKKKSGASPLWCNTPSWNSNDNKPIGPGRQGRKDRRGGTAGSDGKLRERRPARGGAVLGSYGDAAWHGWLSGRAGCRPWGDSRALGGTVAAAAAARGIASGVAGAVLRKRGRRRGGDRPTPPCRRTWRARSATDGAEDTPRRAGYRARSVPRQPPRPLAAPPGPDRPHAARGRPGKRGCRRKLANERAPRRRLPHADPPRLRRPTARDTTYRGPANHAASMLVTTTGCGAPPRPPARGGARAVPGATAGRCQLGRPRPVLANGAAGPYHTAHRGGEPRHSRGAKRVYWYPETAAARMMTPWGPAPACLGRRDAGPTDRRP